MKIYKYELYPSDSVLVEMPKGAKIISAAEKFGNLFVWAEVGESAETEIVNFAVIGTGYEFPDDLPRDFIGTVLMESLVFHVYRLTA